MPTELSNLIDNMATTSTSFVSDAITEYWPWILGLVIVGALAMRFKRLVSNVKKFFCGGQFPPPRKKQYEKTFSFNFFYIRAIVWQ